MLGLVGTIACLLGVASVEYCLPTAGRAVCWSYFVHRRAKINQCAEIECVCCLFSCCASCILFEAVKNNLEKSSGRICKTLELIRVSQSEKGFAAEVCAH